MWVRILQSLCFYSKQMILNSFVLWAQSWRGPAWQRVKIRTEATFRTQVTLKFLVLCHCEVIWYEDLKGRQLKSYHKIYGQKQSVKFKMRLLTYPVINFNQTLSYTDMLQQTIPDRSKRIKLIEASCLITIKIKGATKAADGATVSHQDLLYFRLGRCT